MARHLLYGVAVCMMFSSASALEPKFEKPLNNITVKEGQEASFTCVVHNLGGHKVAWIKADTKAILAIHDVVITHFNRLSVIHNDFYTWTLTLRSVRKSDTGPYMCQVNTDPMRYRAGYLEVVVPPDIVNSETSSDIIIPEGGSARLQCKANGHPAPTITWRREDSQHIVLRQGPKRKVATYSGEVLQLDSVTRSEMGVYLCIANNGIPPTISKRTMVTVNFPPLLEVMTELIAAPLGGSVTLLCRVEASPKAIYFWSKNKEILAGGRFNDGGHQVTLYTHQMNLTITGVQPEDFGTYNCVARNSIGEAAGAIVIHEMELPSTLADEVFTVSGWLMTEVLEYEQSGDPPFGDDEDFPYDREDEEPARTQTQVPDRPRVVLSEETKSAAPAPAPELSVTGAELLVLAILSAAIR